MTRQTKTAHTPGPWTFSGMFQSRGDKMTYEIIYGAIKQDAVLMAAAPEMLEVLKKLSKGYGMEIASLVLPVIRKAEGRI